MVAPLKIVRLRPSPVPVGLLFLSILVSSALLLTGILVLQVLGGIIGLGGLILPIAWLDRARGVDMLALFPLDEQTLTDELKTGVARARMEYQRGQFVPFADLAR